MMDKLFPPVLSIEHFQGLISDAKEHCGAVNINSFLLAEDICKMISDKSLFFLRTASGVLVFREAPLYYQMYMYINTAKPFEPIMADKPIITEFPGMSQLSEKSAGAVAVLTNAGFIHSSTSRRMTADISALPLPEEKSEYKVITASPIHAREIWEIWLEAFDPFINLLPSYDELIKEIAQENVICAIDSDGVVCGVLQMQFSKSTGFIWHEAVSSKKRGKRIGHLLSRAYFKEGLKRNISRHMLWVVEGTASDAFHSKLGYSFDGKFSQQYILK